MERPIAQLKEEAKEQARSHPTAARLDPSEHSSGGRCRMGAISKQGSSTTRWLLVEAGQTAARKDPELRRIYQRLKCRRGSQIAKVAWRDG